MTERRRRGADNLSEQIVESANAEPNKTEDIVGPNPKTTTEDRLIPSGVTLVNCGCSDNPNGAFALGSINTIPGRTSGGKTELMLNMLASCAVDNRFDDYDLIDDDAEYSNHFDLEYLFPPLVDRIKAPNYDGDTPIYSETIEDFESAVLRLCREYRKTKKSFIYVLDSLDSLTSTAELEREWKNALKMAKNVDAVKELQKSYGTEKARIISQVLRMINKYIRESDSALFVVQQIKQNMNPNWGEPNWITSGGNAPEFYSFHRVFLDKGASIKSESKGIKHNIGAITKVEIVKNKLTGKRRKSGIEFPIYEDLGIDDVASCIDFLKTTGHWKSDSGGITAEEFDIKLPREKLIQHVENTDLDLLRKTVGIVWNEIEDDIRLKDRRRRF